MKTFMGKNFLLDTDTAKLLYHNYAENLPIIDYHCHVSPKEIAEDKTYSNITELWLGGEGPAPCRSLMVIAHIDEAALPLVRRLPDPARLTIRLAETADGKQG